MQAARLRILLAPVIPPLLVALHFKAKMALQPQNRQFKMFPQPRTAPMHKSKMEVRQQLVVGPMDKAKMEQLEVAPKISRMLIKSTA
jgi:hypothetical protein